MRNLTTDPVDPVGAMVAALLACFEDDAIAVAGRQHAAACGAARGAWGLIVERLHASTG